MDFGNTEFDTVNNFMRYVNSCELLQTGKLRKRHEGNHAIATGDRQTDRFESGYTIMRHTDRQTGLNQAKLSCDIQTDRQV